MDRVAQATQRFAALSLPASDDVTPAASASARRAPAVNSRWFANTGERVLAATLFLLGAYHILLTASTVLSYTLRYPFMDQFRGNLRYLTLPFPQSVFELENGHHPIIPGIVRVIDLNWFAGMPTVQTLTGWIAGILALAIVLREVRRGLRGSALFQAAAFCAVGTLIGWNANARNFIHPHETVQILLPLLFVVTAIALVARGSAATRAQVWVAAIALCVAATFSFGVGIASFAALFAIAIVQRRGLRLAMLIAVSAVMALLVYFFALPGGGGVKENVSASPELLFFVMARLGAVFAELLRLFQKLPIIALVAWVAGGLGIATIVVSVIGRWIRRESFSDLEMFALGLLVFGATANALIAVSRTAYFFDHPFELFADRYLIWSCVAWTGLTIYVLTQVSRAIPAWQYAALGSVLAFSTFALSPAVWAHRWSAAVYRMTELPAVAEQLGMRDDAQLAAISDEGPIAASRSLDEMRKRKLSMYADRTTLRLGNKVKMSEPSIRVAAKVSNVAMPGDSRKTARLLSGWLNDQSFAQLRSSELWFVGRDGILIGRAAITIGASTDVALLGVPDRLRFEGYVPKSDANEITLVSATDGVVNPIARLELEP